MHMWTGKTHTRLSAYFFSTTWVCWYKKGLSNLDFNETRDDGVAMASARQYINHLHFAPDR